MTKCHTLLAACVCFGVAQAAGAAMLVSNGDFESPDFTGDEVDNFGLTDWVVTSGTERGDEDDGGRVPGTNPNQVVRMGATRQGVTSMYQDLGHNWATDDEFTLTFNAITTWWQTGAQLRFRLLETGGTELWNSGVVALDEHTDSAMPAWTDGTAGSPDTTFEFSFAASDFTGGTAGEELRLEVSRENAILWLDNVSLEQSLIPEPASLVLLGLGGLLIAGRNRRPA